MMINNDDELGINNDDECDIYNDDIMVIMTLKRMCTRR